jgi:polar amino acid transport system permease protein
MTCVVLVLLAMLVHGLVTNSRYQWSVVGHYFLSHEILSGLLRTLELTALSMLLAAVLGVVLALMRQSGARIVSLTANGYIWFFRGTPLLVQLIFWYNISALYPSLSIGIPFGPAFVHGNANSLVSGFTVAVFGLGLNEGAYMCEIVRGGLLSVERGQTEAATALGMTSRLTFQKIVFPQAIRVMIPAVGNELIGMLKYTSLVSVLALPELLYSAQIIYSQTFQTMPLLIVASLWYLIVTTVLTIVQAYVERYYGRGITGPTGADIARRA